MATTVTFSLAAGGNTGWLDLRGIVGAFVISGKITGTTTVSLEVANDPTLNTKGDAVTVETYSASFAKVAALPLPRFLRLSNSGSGTAVIGLGRAQDSAGNLVDLSVQGTESTPTDLF